MTNSINTQRAKQAAAVRAIETFIRPHMTLGLGSGSTAHALVRELGKQVANGLQVQCTSTSRATTEVAREVGIDIIDANTLESIDLTLDGADEITRQWHMIKGGGACLLWEKIIAHASQRMIALCDESKIVEQLGAFPLPVEVVPFGWQTTQRHITRVLTQHGIQNARITQRMQGQQPVMTDSGHYLLDCHCRVIANPSALEAALNQIPGVVDNGLFTREAVGMVIGKSDGSSEVHMA